MTNVDSMEALRTAPNEATWKMFFSTLSLTYRSVWEAFMPGYARFEQVIRPNRR